MSDLCSHRTGDFIQGTWVCAHCYTLLNGRPTLYKMGFLDGVQRQEIDWQAAIATADGVPFAKFVGWMVSYLRRRSLFTISKHDALKLCLEALELSGEAYGAPGACWDRADAKEIVSECICSYWDEEGAGSNA